MREHFQTSFVDTTIPGVSLQSVINHLLRHSLSEVLRSSDSSVMNEISSNLNLVVSENKITPVIQELLATILRNARKGRIHIRADRFRDIIILEVLDQSNYNGYALENSIRAIEPLARTIGGYISIKGNHQLETTVTFSFPNLENTLSYEC